MDTLNATVIGAHVTSSLSSYHHHQWNALSSSLMSENDDDTNEVCGAMKIENPFEREDRSYFSNNSSHTATSQQQQRRQQSESPCIVTRTIPLASCATAAASLSSAFNKRLAVSNKNVSFLE
ncbi:unnamed protein product [Thelazia callipaeda]|uniref:Uncharacterized protein n=1 Tax=Thelazia callipaeda TaxID=103827 RepID=A0A0N5CVU5_THECL|nr:unnamed protein product [Thelazia callipaeda]